MQGIRELMKNDVFAHRYFTLADFVEIYRINPDAVKKDLQEYFGVDLDANKRGCKGAGVGVCCCAVERSSSSQGDLE